MKCHFNMGCIQSEVITRHYGTKLLFVGPPDSGKTTTLYYLKLNQFVKTVPTPDYNVETIYTEQNSFEVVDFGRAISDNKTFEYFMHDTGAVVLFFDCTWNESRLSVATNRLELVLSELPLRFVPVAIVATKQDLEVTLTCERITEYLKTKPYMEWRHWQVFPVSVYNDGEGLLTLLQWLDMYYGRIVEEGPEYQAILQHHREQEEIRRQQRIGLRKMRWEKGKVQFEKNKVNKAKLKAKIQRRKRMNKIGVNV